MAVAPTRRGPDIIPAQSIPLSAVNDQPLPGAAAPPVSASAHPDDLSAGVAKEITAEELAAAEVARRGVNPTEAEAANAPPKKPTGIDPTPPTAADDNDGIVVPADLPNYAAREIAKIRKQARERVDAALKTAKGEAGESEWQKLYEANRDAIVAGANDAAAKAAKAAKESQETAAAAQKELAELRARLAVETKPEITDPKPTRANFDDPDAYDEALASWGEREGLRKADAARAAELAQQEADRNAAAEVEQAKAVEAQKKAQEAEALKFQENWLAARNRAVEKYPDYAEVAEASPEDGGPTITDAMAAAIVQVENGTDVAYHLGQNTDESERIAKIPNPVRQFIEIGRLAERLAAPTPRVRRARPVEIITDAPNAADTTDAEPSMEAYAAQRNAELRKSRQPFFPPGGVH